MEPSVMERYYNLEAKLSQESLKQGKKVQVIRRNLLNSPSIGTEALFRRGVCQEIVHTKNQ